jgi:GT2 family glycosyltransferase
MQECTLDFSVIVVSWNTCDLLAACLSAIGADFPRDRGEIIVTDNASSDGSPAMVRERFPFVRLIELDRNTGFAHGNNIALAGSRGRLLFLINSDIIVHPGTYDRLRRFMAVHPDAGIAGPAIVGRNGIRQRSCMGYPTLWNVFCCACAIDSMLPRVKAVGGYMMRWFGHDRTMPVDVVNGCFWVVRRSAFTATGLLDERFFMYGEDIDWCRRFTEAGWRVYYVHDIEAVHFGGVSSARSPVYFYLEMYRANLLYWRKYHRLFSLACYYCLILLHQAFRALARGTQCLLPGGNRIETRLKFRRSLVCLLSLAGVTKFRDVNPVEKSPSADIH